MACASSDHFGREAVGQVKLANHDFDIDAEVVFIAENFDDAAARVLRGAGPVGDFHVDDFAIQILPVGVDGSFGADDAVLRLLIFQACSSLLTLVSSPRWGVRFGGSPFPAGPRHHCVTFSSMGLTKLWRCP